MSKGDEQVEKIERVMDRINKQFGSGVDHAAGVAQGGIGD